MTTVACQAAKASWWITRQFPTKKGRAEHKPDLPLRLAKKIKFGALPLLPKEHLRLRIRKQDRYKGEVPMQELQE